LKIENGDERPINGAVGQLRSAAPWNGQESCWGDVESERYGDGVVGGGGGGVVSTCNLAISTLGIVNITIGEGGIGFPNYNNSSNSSGSPSYFDATGVGSVLITAGGGSVGINQEYGGISGLPQSFPGYQYNPNYYTGAAGGGGASGNYTINAQNGVDGTSNIYTCGIQYYGGGGGGLGGNFDNTGIGGLGGGGNGYYYYNNAIPNTGGGGGGCANGFYSAGNGGSGVVVIRHLTNKIGEFIVTAWDNTKNFYANSNVAFITNPDTYVPTTQTYAYFEFVTE